MGDLVRGLNFSMLSCRELGLAKTIKIYRKIVRGVAISRDRNGTILNRNTERAVW